MNNSIPEIPTEVVSEKEMAVLDNLAAASSSSLSSSSISSVSSSSSSSPISSSSQFQNNVRSIRFDAVLAAASSSSVSSSSISAVSSSSSSSPISSSQFQNDVGDMEDWGDFRSIRKRLRVPETSLFHRFRRKKGLSVTDIRKSEWCEKQMEFALLSDERETTEAVEKTGRARRAEVEEEAHVR